MSSGSSSFDDDLTDLESVKSSCSEEPRETPTPQILERMRSKKTVLQEAIVQMGKTESVGEAALKARNEELEAVVEQMKKEMEQLRTGAKEDEESILTSIQGSWTIVSSIGLKEFVSKWKEICGFSPCSVYPALFEAGVFHVHFDHALQLLNMYETLGNQEFHRSVAKLGEKVTVDTQTFCTSVRDNALVTVLFKGEEEFATLKRFVKDGRLHIVTRRFGMKCEKIYARVGEEGSWVYEELESSKTASLEAEIKQLQKELESERVMTANLSQLYEEARQKNLELNDIKIQLVVAKLEVENWKTELERVKPKLEKMSELEKELKELVEKKTVVEPLKHKPIQQEILGSWTLFETSPDSQNVFCTKLNYNYIDSSYVEISNGTSGRLERYSWNPNSRTQTTSNCGMKTIHNFIKDNMMVTERYSAYHQNVVPKVSVIRRVLGGVLIVTNQTREGSTWAKYKRDEHK